MLGDGNRNRDSAIQAKIENLKQSLQEIEARQGSLLTKIEKRIDKKTRKSKRRSRPRERSQEAPYSYSAYKDRRATRELEEVERLRRQARDEIEQRQMMQRGWDDRERDLRAERDRRDRDELDLRRSIERSE